MLTVSFSHSGKWGMTFIQTCISPRVPGLNVCWLSKRCRQTFFRRQRKSLLLAEVELKPLEWPHEGSSEIWFWVPKATGIKWEVGATAISRP